MDFPPGRLFAAQKSGRRTFWMKEAPPFAGGMIGSPQLQRFHLSVLLLRRKTPPLKGRLQFSHLRSIFLAVLSVRPRRSGLPPTMGEVDCPKGKTERASFRQVLLWSGVGKEQRKENSPLSLCR